MIKKLARVVLILISLLLVISVSAASVLYIGYATYDYSMWRPSPDSRLDSSELISMLSKGEAITDAEYDIIYRQTGLTRIGIDRVIESGSIHDILMYQDSYFGEYETEYENFALLAGAVFTDKCADMVPLKNGDVIVTSSTHFSYTDIGHSALVVDESLSLVLESATIGVGSQCYDSIELEMRPDFIVLRPKLDQDTIDSIVKYANENLIDIPYNPVVGALSPKYPDEIQATQCAHIIWYAFMKHGIDIDSNGGSVVLPRDIANSEYFEVVQVFGFDPDKLWK